MNIKLTVGMFVEKARAVHGYKYDYSRVVYVNIGTKVTIICPQHGSFEQKPQHHIYEGKGCRACGFITGTDKRRKGLEKFIAEAKAIHGDRYDYNQVVYASVHTNVTIVCPIHGPFEQTPSSHIHQESGCPPCGDAENGRNKRKGLEQFIIEARQVHGNKYDYSQVVYTTNHSPVIIICPEHGPFTQAPNNHCDQKQGCPDCGLLKCHDSQRLTQEEFLSRARKAHGDRYDYSKAVYKDSSTKITIICSIHGPFEQVPNHHVSGRGCRACGRIIVEAARRLTLEEFIAASRKKHGKRYDYSQADYIGANTKLTIVCPKKGHGPWEQTPANHMNGAGCPICDESRGERDVANYLRSLHKPFTREEGFPDCRDKGTLWFDFFLFNERTLIEYQGEQHFHPTIRRQTGQTMKQAEANFVTQQRRDGIKRRWAAANNYRLIEVPYTVKDIPSFLHRALPGLDVESP